VVLPSTVPSADVRVDVGSEHPWATVVWNDPVNLMSYVTWVFRSYFGYPRERAERLMMQVHNEGRATVSRGGREQMEIDTQAMHGFGLWATVEPGGGGGE
jgi:ATP-dependent Clp protease adaptor protein ClpS